MIDSAPRARTDSQRDSSKPASINRLASRLLEKPSSRPTAVAAKLKAAAVRSRRRPAGAASKSIHWQVPSRPEVCLSDALQKRWSTYCKRLAKCQAGFSDREIHQLRVATRRLMANFSLLEQLGPAKSAAKAREKLKRRLKMLGPLRDTHVERKLLKEHVARFPVLAEVCDYLDRREYRLAKELRKKVRRCGTHKLHKWMQCACDELVDAYEGAAKALGTRIFQAVDLAFEAAAERLRAIGPRDPGSIHRTRVAFKRFRYMLESVSPLFTGLGERELRRLGSYQRRLGSIHDLEILQDVLDCFIQSHPQAERPLRAFFSYLDGLQQRTLSAYLARAEDLFQFWALPGRDKAAGPGESFPG